MRRVVKRYAVAALAVVLAIALRYAFDPWLGDSLPFLTLFGAVALTVWFAGAMPAVMAAMVGFAICDSLFLPPRTAFGVSSLRDWIALGLYAGSCGIIVAFGTMARNARAHGRRQLDALRESEEWLRLALDGGQLGTFLYDFESQRLSATPRYKELLGFSADATPGVDDLRERIHPDDLRRAMAEWQRCVAEHRRTEVEYRITAADGSWRWVSSLGHSTYDEEGRPQRFIGVLMDVTGRKQAEERLREADRRKDEFLATLSHELRNPLAPIRNAVAVLNAGGLGEPELHWARSVIERQVDAMARLLDDLLDVTRITRGRLVLRKERVSLSSLVQRSLETSRPWIDAAGLHLSVELPQPDPRLEVDPLRFSQALSNLLNNAARYSTPGGHVRLSARRESADIVVAVEDDGIGIAADHIPHVFDIFYQAATPSDRSGTGLGIGLSLVRGIVEAHGGRIEVRSDGPGRGSCFELRLAATEGTGPAAAADRPDRAAERNGRHLRIVVADDNPDGLESLALMLRMDGHDVHTAADGIEALEVGGRVEPDVALLDLGMPGLDGCEVARRIRALPWGRGVVLVAITGWGRPEDRRRAADAGFDHHLVKPVEPEALAELLGAVVARRRSAAGPSAEVPIAEPDAAPAFDFPTTRR